MTLPRSEESHTIDMEPDDSSEGAGCPDEDALLDLVDGRATGDAARAARAHLLGCEACQEIVAALATSPEIEVDRDRAPLRRGQAVGRYLVLGLLGAGAMGVVYEAYDPELSRRVALKLLRPEHAEGARGEELGARLVREAQALARLAHPNVIAVYDVGRDGDRVFVAMELVAGGTLTAWLAAEPRSERAILEMFDQAGRGLAAAHEKGLVHRDFKPDNVLVGEDGRARVTDFGLARVADDPVDGEPPAEDAHPRSRASRAPAPPKAPPAQGGGPLHAPAPALGPFTLTRTGAAVGTPAYMAPEQIAGKRPDARADVYGFSVALFEALTGERPYSATTMEGLRAAIEAGRMREPPSKLRPTLAAALRKGLSARPEDRFQSMEEMLSALSPPRRRLRVWGAAALIATAVLIAIGVVSRPHEARACAGADEAWGGAWDADAQDRVARSFTKTGAPFAGAVLATVSRKFEDRRAAWVEMRARACEATKVQRTQSEALLDRRVSCLESRREETRALARLFEAADADLVERAISSVDALRPLDDCANPRALGEDAKVPVGMEPRAREAESATASARALRAAGRYAEGFREAESAAAAAREVGDDRRLAEALFVRGHCEAELMRYSTAEATLHEAARLALNARDDADAADAWLLIGGIAGYRREQAEEAYLWLSYADGAIRRLGEDRLRRATYYEKRSLVEWSIDAALVEANWDYARSLALTRGLPIEEASRFLEEHGPIAFDMGRYDVALRIFEADVARIEREKGRDHPEMLEAAENKAEVLAILGRPKEAIAIYRDLLARFPDRAAGYTNDRLAEALRYAGEPQEALIEDERSLSAQKDAPPASLALALPLTGKGLDLWMLGRPREAIAPLTRAAAIRAKAKLSTARAQTDFALAQASWDAGEDRPRALALAESAREAYEDAAKRYGSRWYEARAAAIEAWQKERSR